MDLDAIQAYLDSPYTGTLYDYAEDENVVDAWKQIVEKLLLDLYNNGESLAEKQKWELYREALENVARYDSAIQTEERDELCRIFAEIGEMAEMQPDDGSTMDEWVGEHRPW